MNTRNYLIIGLIVIIVGAGAFFGGYKYGHSKSKPNLAGQRQFGQGQGGFGARSDGARQGAGNGFVNGEVISKDDKSITVKSTDGGSKIIFLSKDSQITKSASGTIADLNKSTQVTVNGSTNADGSITAKFIQVRPQMPVNKP